MQNLVDLDRWPANEEARFGQLKLTIAQFFLPGGSSTQNRGVVPDVAFPVTVDASEFGESTYDNALPWTRIAAVSHVRYGNFAPLLPQLEALHKARVAKDKEFQWWAQDVAEFRTEQAKKYVSLTEAERRAERDKETAKRAQRQAERRRWGWSRIRWPTTCSTTACRPASATSPPTPPARRPPRSAPTRCCASPPRSSPTRPACWSTTSS